jgi:hypothetical protein
MWRLPSLLQASNARPHRPLAPPSGRKSVRGGEGRGEGRPTLSCYRVKLCALPASTLMMLPVDLAEASEAKK